LQRERQRTQGIVIVLVAVYLLLVLVLPLTLSAAVSLRSLPYGRRCPQCGGETLPLLARMLARVSRLTRRQLQRRWCAGCGWEGVIRLPRDAGPLLPRQIAPAVTDTRSTATTRTVDVRWLTVDGVSWKVQLECWRQTGRCYGRLVFVEPSGRLWLDMQPFQGRTDHDVLGQAMALSDRLLASRLREVVSD
jgi:hypothetical protein